MKFLLRKWLEKIVKGAITALLAYATGPMAAGLLSSFGITIDQTQAQAGLWVVYTALVNWLKHQAWTPGALRTLL